MKRFALLLPTALLVTGCANVPAPGAMAPPPGTEDGLVRMGLGHTASVGGPKVTVLAVLEDSRCPMNARCIWAGRVRISARIGLGRGDQTRELTQGEPVTVADGTLELVEVQPDRPATGANAPIASDDYRFGFRFLGGL